MKNIKERRKIINCFKYKIWRDEVLLKDNFTCKCGMFGDCLQAHHIISFNDILIKNSIKTLQQAINCNELWDVNNGIILCSDCHINLHISKK